MKNRVIWALVGMILIIAFVFSMLVNFNFLEETDGRGLSKKKETNLAFETGQKINGNADYLITQRLDPITKKPHMTVKGQYWTKNGGYIEFPSMTDVAAKTECSFAIIDGYAIKCSSPNLPNGFYVCANSFLHNAKVTDLEIPLSAYITDYDEISSYYETLPKLSDKGISFKDDMIPLPLQKKIEGVPKPNYGSSISCGKEKIVENITTPTNFSCNSNEYVRCKSSESISIKP